MNTGRHNGRVYSEPRQHVGSRDSAVCPTRGEFKRMTKSKRRSVCNPDNPWFPTKSDRRVTPKGDVRNLILSGQLRPE